MDNSVNQKRIQIIGIGNGGCNIVSNLARQAEDELYVLCDMEEIGVKHTDNCKTVIFDKDIPPGVRQNLIGDAKTNFTTEDITPCLVLRVLRHQNYRKAIYIKHNSSHIIPLYED